MRPIRLHLDTSDYSAMYNAAPDSVPAIVRTELKQMVLSRQIEIGMSYHVIFELLQRAEPKYREDRLRRARLITELCGQNAFPYPSDLGQGHGFSTTGLWVPRVDLEEIEIERVAKHVGKAMVDDLPLSRHDRRSLLKPGNFTQWVRSHPMRLILLPQGVWPLLFGREFVEDGDLRRYALGEISREMANTKLRFYLTDPARAYETWFETYGREDPIAQRRDQIAEKLVAMIEQLRSMLDDGANLLADTKAALSTMGAEALSDSGRQALIKLRRDVKTFRAELTSPDQLNTHAPGFNKAVGLEAAKVAAQILFALHRERRGVKRSDAIDLMHAMYLPHADLWRGYKAFSDLLIKHKVDFSERVVPTLAELPDRIVATIAGQESGSAALRMHPSPEEGR